ncbi:peroxisome biogenesis factor 10-like [Branchiostoma lanceolatum]|uniref:peroxisome biogenesis factor 10-like n=1 Tax=Branchiostoma lanceolatum TaxID=7740 RepID=UPI003455B7AF
MKAAGQAEIIRANQKDDYYRGSIRGEVADAFQTWFGARPWMRWRRELQVLADVAYFGITTVTGYQTLGEEYCNIIQVDPTQRAIPSTWRRSLLVLLHISTPYLLTKLLTKLELQLTSDPEALGLTQEQTDLLLNTVPVMKRTIMFVHRTHLALFYLHGVFYHIAKRTTGIRYLLVRSVLANDFAAPSYRLLGWLSAAQLGFSLLQHVHRTITGGKSGQGQDRETTSEHSTSAVSSSSEVHPKSRCSLCLETRRHPTATPCGHLFCWECIMEWGSEKPECPLCREPFQLSRLVCLQNYQPS